VLDAVGLGPLEAGTVLPGAGSHPLNSNNADPKTTVTNMSGLLLIRRASCGWALATGKPAAVFNPMEITATANDNNSNASPVYSRTCD
jgi:hypothetical protein